MNNNTVITISRQYGSGGRELSNILAKKLGIKLYERLSHGKLLVMSELL